MPASLLFLLRFILPAHVTLYETHLRPKGYKHIQQRVTVQSCISPRSNHSADHCSTSSCSPSKALLLFDDKTFSGKDSKEIATDTYSTCPTVSNQWGCSMLLLYIGPMGAPEEGCTTL